MYTEAHGVECQQQHRRNYVLSLYLYGKIIHAVVACERTKRIAILGARPLLPETNDTIYMIYLYGFECTQ